MSEDEGNAGKQKPESSSSSEQVNNRRIGISSNVNEFDPKKVSWNTFSAKLESFFRASHVQDIDKPAILLTKLSDDVFGLLLDLVYPEKIETRTFEQLKTHLEQYYGTSVAIFQEREQFYNLRQKAGESINEWNGRVKKAASTCSFGQILPTMLRDIFIIGLLPGSIKDKLHEQDEGITYDAALKLAIKRETATAISSSASEVNYVKPRKENKPRNEKATQNCTICKSKSHATSDCRNKGEKCKHCGRSNHASKECSFKDYTCRRCHEKGHLLYVCTKKKQTPQKEQSTNHMDFSLNNITSKPMIESIKVNVTLNGQKLTMELDTGSAISTIPETVDKQIFGSQKLGSTNIRLTTYIGNQIEVLGTREISIRVKQDVKPLLFYVVRHAKVPLLGRDFISTFNIIIEGIHNIRTKTPSLESILSSHQQVFDDNPGLFNLQTVKLNMRQDAVPIFLKPRPLPIAMVKKVDEELERLTKLGTITPCNYSDWGTPLVAVSKKNDQIRLCGDYKVTLNKYLIPDRHPIPKIEDIFSKLRGGTLYSRIDLKEAYTQMELDDEAKKLCAWSTHRGVYTVNRMPYGITPATSIFQRAMEQLFDKVEGIATFIDDITITGKTLEDHLSALNKALDIIKSVGLKVRKEKCVFLQDSIELLGHIISKTGLKKVPSKVEAISQLDSPKNVSEVKSLMGVVSYYAKFMPRLATIMNPIYALTKKDVIFNWTSECSQALSEVKQLIQEDLELAHFDSDLPTIIETDASLEGISGILFQMADGIKKPVLCVSRTLTSAEKNYKTTDQEALAVYFAVFKFFEYLHRRPFTIHTDHKPLLTLFGEHKPSPHMTSPRMQRWANFLSSFEYTIKHIEGTKNCFADFLSRHPNKLDGNDVTTEDEEISHTINMLSSEKVIDREKIIAETAKDEVLQAVIRHVRNDWKNPITDVCRKYSHVKSALTYESKILMYAHRVVVPATLQDTTLQELHATHLGIVKMKSLARSYVWWPTINKDIETLSASCANCYLTRPNPPAIKNEKWPASNMPFERIHMDFLGPFHRKYFMVIIDSYSKWPEVFQMQNITSAATIAKLRETMSRYGLPKCIVTDNGTQFTAAEFQEFVKNNSIKHITSPVAHPQSNGQAENTVKSFKLGLQKILMSSANMDIHEAIDEYLHMYRNVQHSTTKKTPAEMMFNRKLRIRFDTLFDQKPLEVEKEPTKREFQVGQNVIARDYRKVNKPSWAQGVISKRIGKYVYLIKVEDLTWKRHVNQIHKIAKPSKQEEAPAEPNIKFKIIPKVQHGPARITKRRKPVEVIDRDPISKRKNNKISQ